MARLDAYLVERGIARSRERAKEYILSGKVTVNGKVCLKPSNNVLNTDEIVFSGEGERYVSRGGLKLEKAIKVFNIDLKGLTCADLGASTGGFTDCMLQNGATYVYAVDVGHSQLDEKLSLDQRVVNIEGVNVKDLTLDLFDTQPEFVTADLSFISVTHAANAAYRILKGDGHAVLLIKPQFEAGKAFISKGGIVKDKKVHKRILSDVINSFSDIGFSILGLTPSPIKGGDGNIEYLCYVAKDKNEASLIIDHATVVEEAFTK